jgi:hypothetical protein
MTFLISVSLGAFFWLLWLLRRDRTSLGLPIAYLYSLLLIHVPGALVHAVGGNFFFDSGITEFGFRYAALGAVCFVVGVSLARSMLRRPIVPEGIRSDRFAWFCLIGGWSFVYGLSVLYRIPSVSAVVDKGGAIWMLGVLLGLETALERSDVRRICLWIGALLVYPVMMLLLGGFLSYGSAAIIIVCSVLPISTRSPWRVLIGVVAFSFLSLSIFVNYFQHRTEIRNQVWGGAPLEMRVDSVVDTARDFEWFDPSNRAHLLALDRRLNQNYFVGLAAKRIQLGLTRYLKGESVWQGVLALVPRIIWPEKPVFAGSPQIVSQMTGLWLSRTTSFGVGNVMEFQINFGAPGVIVGFLLLGGLIGTLDRKAALARSSGDWGRVIYFFLPCVALIQPGGSIVEMCGGAAAAFAAAYVWNHAWKAFSHGKLIFQRPPMEIVSRVNHP